MGEHIINSSHEGAADIRGGGRGPRPSAYPGGSLKSGASPAPADQPLLSLLFKKKKTKKKKAFSGGRQQSGVVAGWRWARVLGSAPRPCPRPSRPARTRGIAAAHTGGAQSHTRTGAGTPPLPPGAAGNGDSRSSPPPPPRPPPQGFCLYQKKKKVNLVQSKRTSGTGPTVPRVAQPCSNA